MTFLLRLSLRTILLLGLSFTSLSAFSMGKKVKEPEEKTSPSSLAPAQAPHAVLPKTLQLVTYKINGAVVDPDNGVFIELFKRINEVAGIKINVQVVSYSEAFSLFSAKKVDLIFPAFKNEILKESSLGEPVYNRIDLIFSKTEKSYKNLSSLAGKRVGVSFRSLYDREAVRGKGFNLIIVQDNLESVRKLQADELDAFISPARSGIRFLKESGAVGIYYDLASPISTQTAHFMHHDDPEGKLSKVKIDQAVEKLKKEGYINSLFGLTSELEMTKADSK